MTKHIPELTHFFSSIREDHRVGPTHISVYMALFQLYNLKAFQNPINITRTLVMNTAKICGLATYHKCIKDLHDFGYIRYEPSFNPRIGSKVWMLENNKKDETIVTKALQSDKRKIQEVIHY